MKDDNNNIAFVPVEKVASDQGETAACTLLHRYTSWEELTKGLCLQEPCSSTSGSTFQMLVSVLLQDVPMQGDTVSA